MSDTSNETNPLIDKILDVLTCWREDDFRDAPSLESSAEGWASWDDAKWDAWALDEVAKILADRKPPEPPPEKVEPPKPAKSNADAPPPKVTIEETALCLLGEARRMLQMLQRRGAPMLMVSGAWKAFEWVYIFTAEVQAKIPDGEYRERFRAERTSALQMASIAHDRALAEEKKRRQKEQEGQ